jgi:hypothetical protein
MDVSSPRRTAVHCCAYCGAIAENPRWLVWEVLGQNEAGLLRMPLCVSCSNGWVAADQERALAQATNKGRDIPGRGSGSYPARSNNFGTPV